MSFQIKKCITDKKELIEKMLYKVYFKYTYDTLKDTLIYFTLFQGSIT